MFKHTTITIIKPQSGLRQVQFSHIVIGEFSTLDEARDFSKKYEHGIDVEVWENGELIEEFDK